MMKIDYDFELFTPSFGVSYFVLDSNMLRVYECVFLVLLLVLFAFLRIHMTSNPSRESLPAVHFTVTPVLRITRMRSELSSKRTPSLFH